MDTICLLAKELKSLKKPYNHVALLPIYIYNNTGATVCEQITCLVEVWELLF